MEQNNTGTPAKAPSRRPASQETKRAARYKRRKKLFENIRISIATVIAAFFAILFLMPIVLTITNSFMSSSEISANYGSVFATNDKGGKVYISEKVNLKFIPDIVSFSQYTTVLLKSPEYLLKFWNSVILVGPIVLFQLIVASLASYGFARYSGKLTKFMKRIPVGVMEAAQIDGAGEWQIYRLICMPLCKGALCSAAILVFIDYWNMVEQPLILLSDAEMHPLSVFLSKINSGEIGLAFAVATIYMVPSLLVFLYGEEYLVDGITYQGGVKG